MRNALLTINIWLWSEQGDSMLIKKLFTMIGVGVVAVGFTACGGGGGHSSHSSSSINSTSSSTVSSSAMSFEGVTIEAEDYLRFYDTTAGNTTGQYRTDDVDIEVTEDTNGGFNVGYIDSGDWLEYSITVTSAGTFTVESRVASAQSGGAFYYEIDGEKAGDDLHVNPTGGWQVWSSLTSSLGTLAIGNYALCVQMKSGPFNLNWIKLISSDGGSLELSATPKGETSACLHPVEPPSVTVPDHIKLNQLGYLPGSEKIAVVPGVAASAFTIVKAGTDEVVFEGSLTEAAEWGPALESVKLADFTSLTTPGDYQMKVAGVSEAANFSINADAYKALNTAALKAFYFNRASTSLLEANAGVYQRAAGHADTQVFIHESAASEARPAGTIVSASKGWYDAGDYNKYVVNSGITTYTLLAAFQRFPDYFSAQNVNIPESADAVPDVLNEVMWNLEWMLSMQDPNDGGVYHKLTSKGFSGFVMPAADTSERYMVQKTTAATLDFAAVMAVASRIYADYESEFPGKSAQMLAAAKLAWEWAQDHPAIYYSQPSDIQTGAYGDGNVTDEFAWAAAELYIATKEDAYYTAMNAAATTADVPWWGGVKTLGWISLVQNINDLTDAADKTLIRNRLDTLAAGIETKKVASAYGVSMDAGDFVWGSNSGAMNQAMVLLEAYQLDNSKEGYLNSAQSLLDYVLGRNATDHSFVTGFGQQSPMFIHHRPSGADGIAAPIPGFMVGGPHPDHYGDCSSYPSVLAAKSYVDLECSYSTNEIAINWNAPLVYVSAALQVLTQE